MIYGNGLKFGPISQKMSPKTTVFGPCGDGPVSFFKSSVIRISTTGLGFGFKIINNWSRGWRLEKCKFDFSDKSTLIFHKINFIIPFMRKYRNLVPEKVKMISRNDIKGLLSVWWPISREDSTILTFHVPSLAKGQGLCDIDSK